MLQPLLLRLNDTCLSLFCSGALLGVPHYLFFTRHSVSPTWQWLKVWSEPGIPILMGIAQCWLFYHFNFLWEMEILKFPVEWFQPACFSITLGCPDPGLLSWQFPMLPGLLVTLRSTALLNSSILQNQHCPKENCLVRKFSANYNDQPLMGFILQSTGFWLC